MQESGDQTMPHSQQRHALVFLSCLRAKSWRRDSAVRKFLFTTKKTDSLVDRIAAVKGTAVEIDAASIRFSVGPHPVDC